LFSRNRGVADDERALVVEQPLAPAEFELSRSGIRVLKDAPPRNMRVLEMERSTPVAVWLRA